MSSGDRDIALAAAGALAAGAASEIARPLRELREILAVVVEKLDRHVSEAPGPLPLSWDETRAVRQKLTSAYLLSRELARMSSHLAGAMTRSPVVETVDINKLVEGAIALVRHRTSAETDVFVDLGALPPVRVAPGDLVLVIGRLVMLAADSARGVEGAAISIKTRREAAREGSGDEAVVMITDNGTGLPQEAVGPISFAQSVAHAVGGEFEGTSESGSGSVFELRLPVRR
jgi:signal transduction histidine kinase